MKHYIPLRKSCQLNLGLTELPLSRLSPLLSTLDADSNQPCNTSRPSASTRTSSPYEEEEKSKTHAEPLPPSRLRPNADKYINLTLSLFMLVIPSLLYVLAGYVVALDKRAVQDHQWARLHYIMT